MANTVTDTTLLSSYAEIVKYITIASDGTNETDLVVYDSSAVATLIGRADTLDSHILWVTATVSTASTARVKLEWDATTDVLALDLPPGRTNNIDFCRIGGLRNTAGTGITGDILLTTTGLASGDTITIVMGVRPY